MERESYLAGAMRNSTRLLVSRPISSWAAIGRAAPRPTINMRVVLMPCWAKYTPTRWAMSFDNAFDAIEFCIASVYPAISINVASYRLRILLMIFSVCQSFSLIQHVHVSYKQ